MPAERPPDATGSWFDLSRSITILAIMLFLVLLFLPNGTAIGAKDGAGRMLLSGPAQRLAAVTVLMAGLWLSQALPIGITAMLPLAFYPLLGIESAKVVSKSYIDQNVFLFLGGFVIALGIERWGLHRRIALAVVAAVGSGPRMIVLGFMLATAFLSMWISNTASTLMMLPIGLALLDSLASATKDDADSPEPNRAPELDRLALALMLGTAYAASIGGFSTLVGTPTNVQFAGIWNGLFPKAPAFSAGPWMLAVLPMAVVLLAATWGLLVWGMPRIPHSDRLSRGFFREKLRALGPMSPAERRMAILFAATAVLWITRVPLRFGDWTLLPGWSVWLAWLLKQWEVTAVWNVEPALFHDSTVAVGMMILMFALPAGDGSRLSRADGTLGEEALRGSKLMDWPTAVRLPWEILLLFGGGLAIADAFTATGLSDWLGTAVAGQLGDQPAWIVVLVCCLLMTFLTEVTSNVATVSALIPVLAPAAVQLGVDPRLVCIPAVISASCAFMLPIATPPNAIVFGSGRVAMRDMIRHGILLNLAGAVIITLFTFLFLVPRYGIEFGELPLWAVP